MKLVTRNNLENWADTTFSKAALLYLISRLVRATTPASTKANLPSGSATYIGDGMVLLSVKQKPLMYLKELLYGNSAQPQIVKAKQMMIMTKEKRILSDLIQVNLFSFLLHQDFGQRKMNGLKKRKRKIIGKMLKYLIR